ncbi:MAG TPA: aspartate/glutamate racemase family protein [Acidocella sp.]|jgi:aspartate/glutamate racemase|uniref:aspartate/glutamate racemase family protein n=1 Tax=Acidocella sp. TaxID=50710 RepID=UPI002BE98041|nr:aspartate/glutamate racemase family protein [Acidocella sp.]HVE22663.1 aspartate/glutamate racemase family protein [Acidocella sp.]
MRKIGLIGGLALRAGVFYYEQIQKKIGDSQPSLQLMLSHADVSRVLSYISVADRNGLGIYLGSLANELADAGCEIVAISAVAPHLAISEATKTARVPLANILDVIPAGLEAAGIDRVAVFGNRAVMQTNVFGAVPQQKGVPLEPNDLDWVHNTYNEIALRGKRATQPEMAELSRLAHRLVQKNDAQAILLAGTDLSSFYAEQKPDFPFIDVAQMHIDQIIRLSLAE